MDNHACIGIVYRLGPGGLIEVLWFKKKEVFRGREELRDVLPGGTQQGLQTPQQTLQHECVQELSEYRDQAKFQIFYEEEPFYKLEVPGDDGGKHTKYAFIITEYFGELRTRNVQEPDLAILTPPEWVDIGELFKKFDEHIQSYLEYMKSKGRGFDGKVCPKAFQRDAVLRALHSLAGKSKEVVNRYEDILLRESLVNTL